MNIPIPRLLGLSAPACILVARQLLRQDCTNPEHPLLVVVPTREAVRQLREQLAVAAAQGMANGAFICPRIISASQLTDGEGARMAPPLLQQAALFSVLRRESTRFPHLIPSAGEHSDGDCLARAGQFRQLFTTLCHEGVAMDGRPIRELAAGQILWQELIELYELYREELHRHQWLTPNEAPALQLPVGTRIILACVPSLPERARRLLEHSDHEVEVWLHTDEWHEGPQWFDAWGRPGENWLATPADDVLGLEEPGWQQRFLVCGDMERMAEETARAAGRCSEQGVAVAVCDSGMESAVAQAFARRSVATVRPRGIPFTASGWYRLLQLLARQAELLEETGHHASETDYLSADCATALLRNPVFTTGLGIDAPHQAAMQADQLMQRSLPATLGTMCKYAPAPLREALQAVGSWLSSALGSADLLLTKLGELAAMQMVEGAPAPLTNATDIAASFTGQVDTTCRRLLESAWVKELSVTCVLRMLASAGAPATPPHPARALSLRGWLELSFAPEQHLVLAGLHDGIIPERWPASPYLTPTVLTALGIAGDEVRAARDAYLLRSLYRCRPGKVQAIFTLLNARRDPLFPSSSFFRLAPQRHLATLVGHFFDRSRPIPASAQLPADREGWEYRRLTLPAAENDIARLANLTLGELGLDNPMAGRTLSPSTLHQFLACPLRFWLAKLNGMKDTAISPTQRDLDPKDIGTYLHDGLEAFVRRYPSFADLVAAHPAIQGVDDTRLLPLIEQELDAAFMQAYEKRYGIPELLPRQFQCAAMRRRLRGYARLQLQLWAEGWEAARDAEGKLMLEYEVDWELDGHPLNFRIDRIDRRLNPANGQPEYRVIDYKTGNVVSCYKKHLEVIPTPDKRPDLHLLDAELEPAVGPGIGNAKQAELRWVDLQLPLYTAWALSYFRGSGVTSAYIRLSSNPHDVRVIAWGDSSKDPDFFARRFVERNAKYPQNVEAEPLYENSLRWIRFALSAIAEGRCLVSAEMLAWKAPKQDYDMFGDILALGPLGSTLLQFTPGHHS